MPIAVIYCRPFASAQVNYFTKNKHCEDVAAMEAIAEQVNLTAVASGAVMSHQRALLAESAVRAARKWEFEPLLRVKPHNNPSGPFAFRRTSLW